MNTALSIALPTYNRAAWLDVALTRLIVEIAPYDIPILVSDNASTDDTAAVVARHAAEYPLLTYSCNIANLGPDGNFEVALRQTSTRYVWLLGDTYEIETEAVRQVVTVIEGDCVFDAIIVDAGRRAEAIPGKVYTDRDELLAELGWHMTCMSTLILSRDLVQAGAFERYRNTSFIHVGIIFDYIARRTPSILWLSSQNVKALRVAGEKKVSWESSLFEVWVDSWTNFVLSLPAIYPLQAKLLCISRHGRYGRLFSLPQLVKQRSSGVLNTAAVFARWPALRLATGRRRFLILACALVPGFIARLAVRTKARGR